MFIPKKNYCKVTSRSKCYLSRNEAFGGAANQDMSLNGNLIVDNLQVCPAALYIKKVGINTMYRLGQKLLILRDHPFKTSANFHDF